MEVEINCGIATVDEETKLAKTAAVSDELINIAVYNSKVILHLATILVACVHGGAIVRLVGFFLLLFLFCLSLVPDHFQNIVPKLSCQLKERCKNTSNIVLSA